MRAMVLRELCMLDQSQAPLVRESLPDPEPAPGQLLLRLATCGVCHTELDEIEGRMPPPRLPVIPGHQAVGRVVARGEGASGFEIGERVGVAWIHSACGECRRCRSGPSSLGEMPVRSRA